MTQLLKGLSQFLAEEVGIAKSYSEFWSFISLSKTELLRKCFLGQEEQTADSAGGKISVDKTGIDSF